MLRCLPLAAALTLACSGANAPDTPPAMKPSPDSTTAPATPDNRPRVVIAGESGPAAVRVEVVSTDPEIERGLMYRQHLPPDDGMLFLMGAEDDWHFWMKNTLIPLDIVFITRDFKVAGVLEHMKPLDRTSKAVGKPSLYVLEVNAGWTKAHGVQSGAAVTFEGVKPTDR